MNKSVIIIATAKPGEFGNEHDRELIFGFKRKGFRLFVTG